MRTFKHLVIVGLVVLVAVFLAAPGAHAKKKLADQELDLITAAGQPTIVQSGSGTIFFTDTPESNLGIENGGQDNLQGLIINNVVGENQVATGLNVSTAGTSDGLTQTNTITQSWGATKDFSFASLAAAFDHGSLVAGAPATASFVASFDARQSNAAGSGNGAAGGNVTTATGGVIDLSCIGVGTGNTVKCGVKKADNSQSATGGTGGAGGSGTGGAASSTGSTQDNSGATLTANAGAPGVLPSLGSSPMIAVLTKYADQIIETESGNITVYRQTSSTLEIDGAQASLAALVLNNVSGVNQVANGVNILGGPVALASTNGLILDTNFVPATGASQTNTITQCRGTPCSRPDAVTVGTVTVGK